MNRNEFDRHIVGKFEEHEFPFKSGNWDKLASQLEVAEESSKRRIIWLRTAALAASLLLLVSVLAWLNGERRYGSDLAETTPTVQQEPVASNSIVAIQDEKTASVEQIFTEGNKQAKASRHRRIAGASGAKFTEETQLPTIERNILRSESNSSDVAVADTKANGPQAGLVTNAEAAHEVTSSSKNIHLAFLDKDIVEPSQSTTRKLSLSFMGGFSYGSLNEGYTAGINARKKISKKVFVESDLALVSNRASQVNLTPDQLDAFNTTGHLKEQPAEIQGPSNYFYLQFNPTIGYQVAQKLSVGVGSDFQRVLGNEGDEERLVYQDNETKLLPGLDVGLTGRTEYTVSKSLKAGILYREGVNNFLRGGDTYFDRRYVQIQLKFTILGK